MACPCAFIEPQDVALYAAMMIRESQKNRFSSPNIELRILNRSRSLKRSLYVKQNFSVVSASSQSSSFCSSNDSSSFAFSVSLINPPRGVRRKSYCCFFKSRLMRLYTRIVTSETRPYLIKLNGATPKMINVPRDEIMEFFSVPIATSVLMSMWNNLL